MNERCAVVACSVMSLELEAVIGDRPIELHLLEQGLHNTPKIMPGRIQDKINEILAAGPKRIMLGYGLCSNGIVGVGGGASPLVAPRCHDCISLLLGSAQRYQEVFRQYPGTFFLTAGWIKEQDDPLACVENKYAPRLGLKKAMRGMELELANYKHICYIDNGVGDVENARARTRENCRAFKKNYLELSGTLDYFKALVSDRPQPSGAFISLAPGERIKEEMFY